MKPDFYNQIKQQILPGSARGLAYLLAVVLPLLNTALRLTLISPQAGPWLVLYMLPISLCAYLGGLGPGLLATACSAVSADLYLFQPVNSLRFERSIDAAYMVVFLLVSVWISLISQRSLSASRHHAQDQEQLSLMEQLIDSTDDAVVATTLEGYITHWNRGAEAIFGYRADELLGRSIFSLIPTESHDNERAVHRRLAAGEKVQPYEVRRRHKNGCSVDITTTVSAIRDQQGRIIGISRISGDITQNRRIQDAKIQAETKFRALVEQSLTGVYILQNETIVYANQAFAGIFGYDDPHELIGSPALQLVAPEDQVTVVSNVLHRINRQQPSLRYRFKAVCRDARRIVVEVHGRHFMHEGHSAIIGSIMDVTDAQLQQEEMTRLVAEKTELLRQREQELHTILDNMPAMISYYDPQLRHRFGNRAYCQWNAVRPETLPGLPLQALLNPGQYATLQPHLEQSLQGTPSIFEFQMEGRDLQSPWPAQIHLIPHLLDGKLHGVFTLILDLTQVKAAEHALRESEARFRQLFESSPVGISLFQANGDCMMVNQALATLLGTTRETLLALNFLQIPSWKQSGLLHIAQKALDSGKPQRYECKMQTSFGQLIEVECEFTLPSINGERYLMMLAKDISPYRQAAQLMKQAMEAELDKSRLDQQYRQVVENMADGFFATDRQGRLLEVNDVYVRLSGYSREELLQLTIADLCQTESASDTRTLLERIVTSGSERFETWMRAKDGNTWPSDVSTSYAGADGGRIYAFVRDMTEMKRAEDEIRRLAFYDSLTRLPNRQLLLDRLSQALLQCKRSPRHGALLFIDLDNFKLLNDTLGHDMGDRLLVAVAERLKSCVRAKDTVARLGGDEFIIMLEGLDPQRNHAALQIRTIASAVMEALNRPYLLESTEYHNTPSIGVALFSEAPTSIEELLKQADLAMYQAKAAGRNTVCFFDPVTQTAVENRTALEAELRNALREDHLILHYQPQVDRHGRTVGAEALVRWQHPQQGLISPGEFISLAEETGLVYPLGLRVLELACEQLARWQTRPELKQMSLAVNVSARQFRHRDFVPQISELLAHYAIDPQCLKLELTESLLLNDIDEAARKMAILKTLGIKFSLDDFGTGYSSLAYLKALPLEQLKIDQSFVRDILTDPNDAAIVRAIIVMGHSLGLKIVAEGVESAEQWDILMREGCDIGQGYYFSAPVPGFDMTASLERDAPLSAHIPWQAQTPQYN